jgi:tetratricopeptide (TPR) repeat protein
MSKSRSIIAVVVSLLAATGCTSIETAPSVYSSRWLDHRQGTSLLGEPLRPMALDAEVLLRRERELDEAAAAYEAAPDSEEAIIWLGRRQAYLGRYDLAIRTFTAGLRAHPDSYRLLRHRGHRWITLRRFDRAVADLERAARLIEGVPDEIEPDGLPNRLNQPRSTSHSNICYHLGLARYLRGEYERAAETYRRGLDFCTNDDMAVAMRYWLYLSLRQLGADEAAREAMGPTALPMDIIENDGYHRLLLLFNGRLTLDEVAPAEARDAIQSATTAYGLASWHRLEGDDVRYRAMLDQILAGESWPAFGYIAAEVEEARLRDEG